MRAVTIPPNDQLTEAIEANSIENVRAALDNGANPNLAKTTQGLPVFLYATFDSAIELLELLLNAGLDPNARDDRGATILMHAAKNQALQCLELLIASGADVRCTDNDGETLRQYGAKGYPEFQTEHQELSWIFSEESSTWNTSWERFLRLISTRPTSRKKGGSAHSKTAGKPGKNTRPPRSGSRGRSETPGR